MKPGSLAGLALLAASCLAAAHASGVRISPVVVEVANARQPGVVQVTNESDAPRTLQGQALRWTQAGNKDVYEDSDDLVIVPPMAEIAPGATQIFRVMLRQPALAPQERTYRLLLEDITPATRSDTAVAIRYVHNLPLLIAPAARPTALVRWSECRAAASTPASNAPACIQVANEGNRRVKLRRIVVAGSGWEQAVDLGAGTNLLAGSTWQWTLPRNRDGAPERVSVEAADGQQVTVEPAAR